MMLNRNKLIGLKSLISSFNELYIKSPILAQQIRAHGKILPKPKLRNPYWFVRKQRTIHEDFITVENKNFIKDVIQDKFTASAAANQSLLKIDEIEKQIEWQPSYRRTGLLARKIGNYPLWSKTGKKIPTTLLQIIDSHVIKYIPPDQYTPMQRATYIKNPNKYGCLLVGSETIDPELITKEYCGLFKSSGVMPKKFIGRFLISPEAALLPGTPLNVTHYRVGDYIDVRGKTVYHGFQGVVKRYGFKGGPASHGNTKTHRRPGNIGGGGEKGRVWPGTKMPGHMGNRWRKLKGVQILRINTKYNVMWVKGNAIAGETNSLVYIYDTILPLKQRKVPPPFPTSFSISSSDQSSDFPEDIWLDDIHCFKDPTITFEPSNEK